MKKLNTLKSKIISILLILLSIDLLFTFIGIAIFPIATLFFQCILLTLYKFIIIPICSCIWYYIIKPHYIICSIIGIICTIILLFLKSRKNSDHFEELEVLANQGDIQAQYKLGQMYYNGKGTEQNLKKAFKFFQKSAKQNFSESQFMLGEMYYNGIYVRKSLSKAKNWYEKASKQEHKKAKKRLDTLMQEK